jgi:hypothetical protein
MMDFREVGKIATNDLQLSDIPGGRINWEKFSTFALTFDPLFENLTTDELSHLAEAAPRPSHDIKVLRAFLYNWQRIWNNKTYEAPSDFYVKVQEVLEWIRAALLEK